MTFKIKFIRGMLTIATIDGIRELNKDEVTMGDVEKLIETERFLEKLMGLRVHIDGDMKE